MRITTLKYTKYDFVPEDIKRKMFAYKVIADSYISKAESRRAFKSLFGGLEYSQRYLVKISIDRF